MTLLFNPDTVRRVGGRALSSFAHANVSRPMGSSETPQRTQRFDSRDFVQRSLLWLEGLAAGGAILDAALVVGLGDLIELPSRAEPVFRLATRNLGFDAAEAFARILPSAGRPGTPTSQRPSPDSLPLRVVANILLPVLRSAQAVCPIDSIELAAKTLDIAELGFRCRCAYEALGATCRRLDPTEDPRTRTVGRAYVDGRLGVHEVAQVLAVSVPDAVAFLEAHGYTRPLPAAGVTPEVRRGVLERARADRLRREGRPEHVADSARRSAIASSRIEGIDCRPWMSQTRR